MLQCVKDFYFLWLGRIWRPSLSRTPMIWTRSQETSENIAVKRHTFYSRHQTKVNNFSKISNLIDRFFISNRHKDWMISRINRRLLKESQKEKNQLLWRRSSAQAILRKRTSTRTRAARCRISDKILICENCCCGRILCVKLTW